MSINGLTKEFQMAFNANISKSFADLSATFATQVANDVIRKLSLRYGFDVREACDFIYGEGIKVETARTEILKKDLPWCGEVDPECCNAISFGNKLFRQCSKAPKRGGLCTPCANQLDKTGSLRYGDVTARMACGAMDYEVGKDKVVTYAGYMVRNKLTEADVLAAAQSYGLTIDPDQFVAMPKRGRPSKKDMSVPDDTESSDDEAEVPVPEPVPEPTPDVPEPVVEIPVPDVPDQAGAAEVPAEAAAEAEEEEEEEEITIEKLNIMSRSDLNELAKKHGVVASNKDKKIALLITKLNLIPLEEGEEDE